jgi:hypothetical protein
MILGVPKLGFFLFPEPILVIFGLKNFPFYIIFIVFVFIARL